MKTYEVEVIFEIEAGDEGAAEDMVVEIFDGIIEVKEKNYSIESIKEI